MQFYQLAFARIELDIQIFLIDSIAQVFLIHDYVPRTSRILHLVREYNRDYANRDYANRD